MQTITNRPPASRPAPPPSGGFLSSPLFFRVHAALTGVLVLGFLVLGVLAVAGQLRVGKSSPAAASDDKDKDRAKAGADDPESPKDKPKEKEGRYQIAVEDDARSVLSETGKLGILGSRLREAWVFRYKGGFLETKLETDFNGEAISSGQVPEDWGRFLGGEEDVKAGKPEALNKEGYVVLLSMVPVLSVEQALEPLHPHLGAMFTAGPAGPLHSLVPFYHEVWRRREYRLFLSAGPPKGKTGPGFNLWTGDMLLVRSAFVNDETAVDTDPTHTLVGKDLEAGKELTVLQRQRGLSVVRLKARFLSDKEAVEKAKAAQ